METKVGIPERIAYFKAVVVPNLDFDPTEELLNIGFFEAPASTKYHGSFEGGLFVHSMNMMSELVRLTKNMKLNWEREASPYIIGAFHDLCKCDQYIMKVTGDYVTTRYEFNQDTLLHGHGEKSVMIAATLTRLTLEEVACIRYHMGAFTEKEQWHEYTDAIHEYPNVLWTHVADMAASHINERLLEGVGQ